MQRPPQRLTACVAGMAMLASGRPIDATGRDRIEAGGFDPDRQHAELNDTPQPQRRNRAQRIDAQSSATRQWLARQPPEPALVRVVPRIAVANLEDRIAWFDDAMTEERLHGRECGPPESDATGTRAARGLARAGALRGVARRRWVVSARERIQR